MKKYWVPASITALAVGAFFVFQNAGVVSPKLGYWEQISDLSSMQIPSSNIQNKVNRFSVNTATCEYRIRYKSTVRPMNCGNGPQDCKQQELISSIYPNHVQRSSDGSVLLSFSTSHGANPFRLSAGGYGSTPGQYSLSFSKLPQEPNNFIVSLIGGYTSPGGYGVGMGSLLTPGVSLVRLEKRCYEFPPTAPADMNEAISTH